MTTEAAASRLFVYGTLMMPAVLQAVCGVTFTPRRATLHGYARYQLRARVYPAIVPAAGAAIDGLLCDGIDGPLWQCLDHWESELYTRALVNVCDEAGTPFAAQTYILASPHHHLLGSEPWSPVEFEHTHLAAYLTRWTTRRP